MHLFDTIQGTDVQPDAPPPNGEIVDKTNVAGVIARFLGTVVVQANGRNTPKHAFRIPSGQQFALWGDAALNALLRKVQKNEIVALIYDGKRPNAEGNEVHSWRLKLITTRGAELEGLVRDCSEAYTGLRAAIEHAKAQRSTDSRFKGGEEPPPPDDSDAPSW